MSLALTWWLFSIHRYYRCFAVLYWFAGQFADVVMVNSNWTKAHIDSLWSLKARSASVVVFPPCNTSDLQVQQLRVRQGVDALLFVTVNCRACPPVTLPLVIVVSSHCRLAAASASSSLSDSSDRKRTTRSSY